MIWGCWRDFLEDFAEAVVVAVLVTGATLGIILALGWIFQALGLA